MASPSRRGVLIAACVVLAAGGFAGAYFGFEAIADRVAVGAFARLLHWSSRASEAARWSFATSGALLLTSLPLAGWVGAHCRMDRAAWSHTGKALLTAAMALALGVLAYRSQSGSFWGFAGDFSDFANDKRVYVLWNPLTQINLLAAAASLTCGLAIALTAPEPKPAKRPRRRK